jgi:hypothetical protein
MSTKATGQTPPEDMLVAYDNGCFAGSWQAETWATWLHKQRRGLFAVVPDVVRDACATRHNFERYASEVAGWQPVAYAAQDGIGDYPPPWDDIDVLFVGGSDAFKLSEQAWRLCQEAKARGKWVHVGRVNSFRRMRACHVSDVDSVDGTFLKWGAIRKYASDPRWPQLCGWLDDLHAQQRMWCA